MTIWTSDELESIGSSEEVTIATRRQDGSLRKPVIVWIVRVGDDLYVRAVRGRTSPWFKGALTRLEGRVEGGGAGRDVAFEDIGSANAESIDAAYWSKYDRYPGIVPSIVSPTAQAATIRLVPR